MLWLGIRTKQVREIVINDNTFIPTTSRSIRLLGWVGNERSFFMNFPCLLALVLLLISPEVAHSWDNWNLGIFENTPRILGFSTNPRFLRKNYRFQKFWFIKKTFVSKIIQRFRNFKILHFLVLKSKNPGFRILEKCLRTISFAKIFRSFRFTFFKPSITIWSTNRLRLKWCALRGGIRALTCIHLPTTLVSIAATRLSLR